jgi:hypothetical protein
MSVENKACRLLIDLKNLSKNKITVSLREAQTTGKAGLDDNTLHHILQLVQTDLDQAFEGGINQLAKLIREN